MRPDGNAPGTAGITFLISSLQVGGAERQLVALALGLSRRGHRVTVITYRAGGALAADLKGSEVTWVSLGKRSRWDLAGPLLRLRRYLRQHPPRVLHGYLPDANILALVSRRWTRSAAVVWGVRASAIDWSLFDRLPRWIYRLSCRLARRADLIIANSRAGMDSHVRDGYPADRMRVIPNGIALDRFQRDPEGGRRLRASWGAGPGEPVIGLVGRLDPLKDHTTFLRAAALFLREHPTAHFLCVGGGSAEYAVRLRSLSEELGIAERVQWLDGCTEMSALYSALDLLVSTSITEGFSNVLGEAMACDVTCVATDVGDSAWLLGPAGLSVPRGDVVAAAEAWSRALALRAEGRLLSPRARVEQEFSVERLVERTEDALERWLGRPERDG